MSASHDPNDGLQQPEQPAEAARSWKQICRPLLQILPIAGYVADLDGVLRWANPAGERLAGHSSQELAGMEFGLLFTAASKASLEEMARSALAGHAQPVCEAEFLAAGGDPVRVRIHTAVLRDQDQPFANCYVVDLLDPRWRPDASASTESMFRWMTKNLTEMVMAYDMQRRLVFANPATQSLTGYSLDELEKAHFICWVHKEDRARMLGYWDTLFEGRSFHEEEYRLVTKDGRTKWVVASWGPILDDQGRQAGVQGREREITDQKLAEATLRHSEQKLRVDEERYRTLFENSPFPLWEEDFSEVKAYVDSLRVTGVTDFRDYLARNREAVQECLRRVRMLDVNRAAREFYGAPSKQKLLEDLAHIFDECALEVFRDEIVALAEGESPFRAEFPVRTLDGESRLVTMNVSLVESCRHDWSRVIVSFFDITDRKQLEEQLVQAQKMESLGRLAGGIAHDFNNLLTVINGYSELLLGRIGSADPARPGLTEIRRAGERCAELTGQLLTFSRKQVIKPRLLDLNALILESQGVLERVIGDDIWFSVSLDPTLGTIEADAGLVHQVLMNLIVNAREAMPAGGMLTLSTRNVTLAPDHREQAGGSPFVLLEVRDTGTGVEERARQHMFEPFFTTKKGPRNSGLGLATAFAIVSQAGGHIKFTSELGHGATFRVYLPQVGASADSKTPVIGEQADFRGSGTVLVVEDREYVRGLICSVMEELGYTVLTAGDGGEALTVAGQQDRPIDLLLTDVIMPGMNGRQLAEQLRPSQPGMKVLFVSGYSDQFLNRGGSIDSRAEYLQKPFTRAQLVDALRRVMESR